MFKLENKMYENKSAPNGKPKQKPYSFKEIFIYVQKSSRDSDYEE